MARLVRVPPTQVVVFLGGKVRSPAPFSDDPNVAIEVWPPQVSECGVGGFGNAYSKFLVELPDESCRRKFILLNVATWKIPDIRIPPSMSRPMTKEHLGCIDEETGHDMMDI
jgi:hypothetical protein